MAAGRSRWYYAAASGEIETGWLKLGGTWYYLDPSRGGAMLTGSYRVGSTLYHARPSGAARRPATVGCVRMALGTMRVLGCFAHRLAELKRHLVRLDRKPESWQRWYKDGSTWYYSDGSGAMLANRLDEAGRNVVLP